MQRTHNSKRFAMTGATGALGYSFAREFMARHPDSEASLLVRRGSSSFQDKTFQTWLAEMGGRISLIDGDIRSLDTMPKESLEALLGCEGGLWHFAAVTDLDSSAKTAEATRAVNLEGTATLLRLMAERDTPLYHISTAYVAGDRQGLILESENECGQKFHNPYEASKSASETLVREAISAGKKYSIFRPSIVVGDDAGMGGLKIVDACAYSCGLAVKRGEPFVFRLSKTAGMNLVHASWVTSALVDLARLPSGAGFCYHLTASSSSTWLDIGELIRQHVPTLQIRFEPALERRDLPSASKLFDKSISDVRPYLEAHIEFGRSNTDRDLSPAAAGSGMNLQAFVASRLHTELTR